MYLLMQDMDLNQHELFFRNAESYPSKSLKVYLWKMAEFDNDFLRLSYI